MVYTYQSLCAQLQQMPPLRLFSIGRSVRGRQLFCIKHGSGRRRLLLCGAHHGTEWMTSMVLMRFLNDLLSPAGDAAPDIPFDDVSLYFVPMLNPDGIEIHAGLEKPAFAPMPQAEALGGGMIYWQANANGVDLNHNYAADWPASKAAEAENGILGPGPTRFSGTCAESEPESAALAELTRRIRPEAVLALHSQGEEIYYDFGGEVPDGGLALAAAMAEASGYALKQPEGMAACGGYKDWFISAFHKPGFTVEIGLGSNPLPPETFDAVYEKVRPLLRIFSSAHARRLASG